MDRPRGFLMEGWHLDKRVPLALIVAILAQTFAFGYITASITSRVDGLEKYVSARAMDGERLARMETQLLYVTQGISEIRAEIKGRPERRP